MRELVTLLVSGGASALLTWLMKVWALSTGTLDFPSSRSSHVRPMPRGGGLAVASICLLSLVALTFFNLLEAPIAAAVGFGGLAIALIGYCDDRFTLRALPRLIVHLAAATFVVLVLIHSVDSQLAFSKLPKFLVSAALIVGLAWTTNLFNFMDGIDGFAASQALFISMSSLLLIFLSGGSSGSWTLLFAASSGACIGFLSWNWPPARIFMGDVGSAFLGFWFGAIAIVMAQMGILTIWTSLILGSVFFSDATTTLLRRILRRERWYDAHRSHAYQRLARRWNSHLKVTLLLWGINLFFVLPLAVASVIWSDAAAWIAIGVGVLLCSICLACGAGASK